MKKRSMVGFIATVLVSTFLIAGCGSAKEAEKSEKPKEKEEFVYAMSGIFKPFNYKDGDKLTGFDVEIGEALAEKMGMEARPIAFPWETIIQGLRDKKFDAILGSMTVTEERLKAVNFTDSYYKSGSRIFIASDNHEIKSKEDLKGKKIGVNPATIYETIAKTLTDEDKVMNYSQGIMPAMMDIKTGRVDAVIVDDILGRKALKESGLELKPIDELLQVDDQAIAVNKDDDELKEKINKALEKIMEDGTYEKISEKWFGYNLLDTEE